MLMDHTFKLPPRLAAIAALVPDGAHLADIGTDHALLPIRLLLDGKIQSAVATDIRPGPLSRAKENAYAAGVQDISCILCDGLTGVTANSVDTVVIAGMGGENIAGILRAAPWACAGTLLLLQPMSRPEELRAALPSLGLTIRAEQLVRDAGRLYSILAVRAGAPEELSVGELYCGKYSLLSGDPLFADILSEQEKRLETAIQGLERSERERDRERLKILRLAAADIAEMRRKHHGDGS
ncbi:MAG TPA: SAM-dependent methyltransferase [Ruminococcaceae bacterium]|nr:SAM-dependent methyltransferase [Oscillospiraceae bacterium]